MSEAFLWLLLHYLFSHSTSRHSEIKNLCEALRLPSVTSLFEKSNEDSNVHSVIKLLQANRSTVLGSLLPVANQQLKHYASVLSSGRIQGNAVRLEDGSSYVSAVEAAQWRRFLPFSPLLTGDLLL